VLTQSKGIYFVECDHCGTSEELEDTFEDSRQRLRDLGWQARKAGQEWVHFCPECREE